MLRKKKKGGGAVKKEKASADESSCQISRSRSCVYCYELLKFTPERPNPIRLSQFTF